MQRWYLNTSLFSCLYSSLLLTFARKFIIPFLMRSKRDRERQIDLHRISQKIHGTIWIWSCIRVECQSQVCVITPCLFYINLWQVEKSSKTGCYLTDSYLFKWKCITYSCFLFSLSVIISLISFPMAWLGLYQLSYRVF